MPSLSFATANDFTEIGIVILGRYIDILYRAHEIMFLYLPSYPRTIFKRETNGYQLSLSKARFWNTFLDKNNNTSEKFKKL